MAILNKQIETKLGDVRKWKMEYKYKALITASLGTFMSTMDVSITNISFPILTSVFDTQITTVMWVALAYTLTATTLMLTLGKVADQIGNKKLFFTGMTVFTLGLLFCSFSRRINQLILARIFQAAGSSMTMVCSTAIVTDAFPGEERGKGLGLLGAAVSAGFITGPILGGVLLEWFQWRSLFYSRVPLGSLTIVLTLIFLRNEKVTTRALRFDVLGMLMSSIGLLSIMLGISQIHRYGPASAAVYILVGYGLLCLACFIFIERQAIDPIIDLSLFKNRVFSGAIWSLFLTFVGYPAYSLLVPFYLMQAIGMSPALAGVLMAVVSMTSIVIGPISGGLSDRFQPFILSSLGCLATLISYLAMGRFGLETQISWIIFAFILFGVGVAAFQAPNNSSIMGSVSNKRLGSAAALIATQRQIGLTLGMALTGSLYSIRKVRYLSELAGQGLDKAQAAKMAIPLAFHDVILAAAFIMIGAVIFSLVTWDGGRMK